MLASLRTVAAFAVLAGMFFLPFKQGAAAAQAGGTGSENLTIGLPGAIDPGHNNVELLGGGRYAVVAPFGDPSWLVPVADGQAASGSDQERSASGANAIWSIDTTTGEKMSQVSVGYFPSRIAVNRAAGVVAVRHLGLAFDENGSFLPQASVSILKMDAGGVLRLVATVAIPAAGRADGAIADGAAPDDVFVSKDGSSVFVTNGASIFAYAVSDGSNVAKYDVVDANLYGPENEITSLSYHADTATFGVISGNAIYVNDAGPDSLDPEASPIAPSDLLTLVRFSVNAAAEGGAVASFAPLQKIFFVDCGISAGSNVEFNEDATQCFIFSARKGLILGIDVEKGYVNASVKIDLQARDDDDAKSVRALVYSPRTHTIAIAVTGKRITHPAEYARRITHPAEFARRITHPAEFARRITHPAEFALRRDVFDSGTVSPRVYLVADFGRGNLVRSFAYAGFAQGTTISAAQFGEQGTTAYIASTDGHLYSLDVTAGTLVTAGTPGSASSTPAISEQVSRAAVLGAMPADESGGAQVLTGSVTVVRSLTK